MNRQYTSLRLEITSKCNLNCKYCHNEQYANKAEDLSTEEILFLVRNLKRQYNINKVLLTGGEPLINKDVCKLVSEISDMGIKLDMVTNGTLLTENLLLKLEKAGLKRIRLSIDEVGQSTKVRGLSNPDSLWDTAKMVKEKSKIDLCIHTVCSNVNVNTLFDVYKNVIKSGASRWRVFDMGYQGGLVSHNDEFNLTSYYHDMINSIKHILVDYISNNRKEILDIEINSIFKTSFLNMEYNNGININISDELSKRILLSPCNYITDHQISIRSNGNATLCQYFHDPIFEYRKHNFDVKKSISNQNIVVANELTMNDLEYCLKCKYCLICNSGCRSRAQFLTGNIKDADPVACYLQPLIHKYIASLLPDGFQRMYNGFINPSGLDPKYDIIELLKFLEKKGFGDNDY